MKKELLKVLAVFKRLIMANIRGEHYWFLAKPAHVHIKNTQNTVSRKN
ncbi:MAG: hypothetical protein K9H26_01495 [Prolixibacteraceae bacterium]|nr:hypothetical protein [Prolixibacteraceae bacterium]